MNKTSVILTLLILASLLLRIGYSFSSPVKGWDEAVYSSLGWDLKSNPLDYGFNRWADKNPVMWDKAGFRAPLLPYILAGYYAIAGNNYFLINFLIPVLGTIGVFLVFLLGKELFNERIGLYSAAFLAFLPLHVLISGRIMTDVLVTTLLTLAVIFFWYGFEKNRRIFKPLFGFTLGLAFLARYTTILLPLVLVIYLLLRHRNIKFIKNIWTWSSVAMFFITISPWLIYSYFEYDNPLGALLHAKTAASYWGGDNPWYFFFTKSFEMFSIITIVFTSGLVLSISKLKNWKLNLNYVLLVIWLIIFLIFGILVPHKEERFILPLVPSLVIISAFFVNEIKSYRWHLFILVALILLAGTIIQLNNDISKFYNEDTRCFLESMGYLRNTEENAIIFAESSPPTYYYTHKENHFISHGNMENLINDYYKDRQAYLLLSNFDGTLEEKDRIGTGFEITLACPSNEDPKSLVFKYNSTFNNIA